MAGDIVGASAHVDLVCRHEPWERQPATAISRLPPLVSFEQAAAAIGVLPECQRLPPPDVGLGRFGRITSLEDGAGSRFRDVSWLREEVLDILDMIAGPAPRIGTEAEAREA